MNTLDSTPPLSLLIISEPGFLRDGILSILQSHRAVKIAGVLPFNLSLADEVTQLNPDLVIIDCSNNLHSLEHVLHIKSKNPMCPVVAIVENTTKVKFALQMGAAGVLVKGFSSQDLYSGIQGCFASSRSIL